MSFYGNLEDAKSNAKKATVQIDGLEPGATSPVRDGGATDAAGGAAPLIKSGPKEFTTERTRHGWRGNQGGMRREFPTEGVTKKKS